MSNQSKIKVNNLMFNLHNSHQTVGMLLHGTTSFYTRTKKVFRRSFSQDMFDGIITGGRQKYSQIYFFTRDFYKPRIVKMMNKENN